MPTRLLKIVSGCALVVVLFGAGYWWYRADHGPILDFSYSRDAQEVMKIFERDHYWLLANDEYYPDVWLKYRSPSQEDSRYFGQLQIKVLRENDLFVGFTAYYLKYPTLGFILFVAVNPEFRGKHYGEQLVHYAIKDMKSKGVKQIQLVTRVSNERAQKLYKRIGFYESSRSDGYVHFTIDL